MDTYPNDELQSALVDIQRYLLDQIPPLTALDAVTTLMNQPPQTLMQEIHTWAVEQSRNQSASMSDFLFYALRKVYLVSALKLIDRKEIERFLNTVIPLAMEICPPGERESLRMSLTTLRDTMNITGGGAPVDFNLGVVKPSAPQERGVVTEDVVRSARRLSLVVDRLQRHIGGASASAQVFQEQQPAQLVTMAAASSTTEHELEEYIQKIQPYTGESDPDKLFKVLAAAVPNWDIAIPATARP